MSKVKFKIIDGGKAIPIGNNLYKLIGRSHEEGGIGIELKDGNAKTIIEGEDNEIFEPKTHEFRVLSNSIKIGNKTPAQLAEAGYNPDIIFKAQQSINGNYGGSYGKDGLIKRLVNFIIGDNEKENDEKDVKKKPAEGEPINEKEVRNRQVYAESGFDSNAGSGAGARGLFQIMPDLLKDYNKAKGTNYTVDDLYNDEINTSIRDWKMGLNLSSAWATKNAAPDSVVYAKALGGYNMGNTDFIKGLEEAKKAGVDIYNSMDWIDTKWFPKETVDYINFVLRNQDNSAFRNQAAYEASKKLNKDKVDILNNNFKNGGQINMKLKHKNKQDITDVVMNEILPHSTGERKKFIWGGSEIALASNAGLNLLSGLGQGIAGSINAKNVRKMYDGLKRQSTYIPITREHINTKVDVEPQLNLTAQTEYNLRRNAEMNTASAKVARSQARVAALDRIRQDNAIYSDKYNREAQLRNAEAELQTRYNLADLENKLTDIREQNDFDMQKAIGKANASTMEAQTWGNAIASSIGNTATSLMDYATMKNDLLKSNNEEAWNQYNEFQWGMYTDGVDENGKPILKSKYTNPNHPLYNSKRYKRIRNHFGIS